MNIQMKLVRASTTAALALAGFLAQPALAQQEMPATGAAAGPLTIRNVDPGNCGGGSSAVLQDGGNALLLRVGRLQAMGPNDRNDTCTLTVILQVNPGTTGAAQLQIDRAVEAVQVNNPGNQGQASVTSTFTLNRIQQNRAQANAATTVTRTVTVSAQDGAVSTDPAPTAAPGGANQQAQPQAQMVNLDDLGLRTRAQGTIRLQATFNPRTQGAAQNALVRLRSAMLQVSVVQQQQQAPGN